MIAIVIVAHSARLTESVRELVEQVLQSQVPLATAGGTGDPDNPFGTDATLIRRAIESVYSEAGVVVLMDLGSALLSAEMALEHLAEDQRERVLLCPGALVEGAIAAAVQSRAGGDLEQVAAAARRSLAAKVAQLRSAVPAGSPALETDGEEELLTVRTWMGLHARPAAQLVIQASRFQAEITVRNVTRNTGAVSAKSINRVTTLGVRQGHQIAIQAEGPDAAMALAALKALVKSNFGEAETAPETRPAPPPSEPTRLDQGELSGIPASPGIAIGPAILYHAPAPQVPAFHIEDPESEWQRLQRAVQTAGQEIQAVQARTAARAGEYQAAIFAAHLLFLEDPALIDATRERIFTQRRNAETCWQAVADETIAAYRALEDPYLQMRAIDVADVSNRVLRLLTGTKSAAFELSAPAILVVADLTPSDLIQLDLDRVLGLCAAQGGATSHSVILARSLGIPAVVGVGPAVLQIEEGTLLALDGQEGQVWINPKHAAALQQQRQTWLKSQQRARAASQGAAITRDGRQVAVMANIQGIAEVRAALRHGAEGIGLLRTEFLYFDRAAPPPEAELAATYQGIAALLDGRPLVIRTLDVGGDKPLPYLDLQTEANPFLGYRGLRLCLERPELLRTQLRAILQASPGHQIKVMFPMVSSVEEMRAARQLLAEVRDELRRARIPVGESVEVGAMVEVPAAVNVADQLAAEVDFFSIGTNDLSQYIMAADRTNARVADLADGLNPAVLRAIRQVVQAGRAAGIRVALCGELAGDPMAAPILLGLGLDEFSLNPPAIPTFKQIIARLSAADAEDMATEALDLESPAAVRHYVAERLPRETPQ